MTYFDVCLGVLRTVDYEAIFYGAMSSNHPELMRTYPNPLLDFIPQAERYAIERSQASLNRSCSGLHFPHVLAPWGVPQYSSPYPNYSDREGAMSSGPVSVSLRKLASRVF